MLLYFLKFLFFILHLSCIIHLVNSYRNSSADASYLNQDFVIMIRCVAVVVHVTGKFEGRTFEDRDVTFVVGEADEAGITAGVEKAAKKSKKGEKSKLVVKPKYAYGTEGNLQYGIPPDATVEYEVELKSFELVKIISFRNSLTSCYCYVPLKLLLERNLYASCMLEEVTSQ